MEDLLRRLSESLDQWHPAWAYLLLSFSALLENLIPPLPGDTVVVFSAYLVGRGILDFWSTYLATCTGGLAGFLIMYYVGYTRGRAFFVGRGSRFFPPAKLARAEEWLARYGVLLVLGNRFLGGIRAVVALVAGIGRMSWKKVMGYGAVSILAWTGLLLYVGSMVGQHWEVVVERLGQYHRLLSTGGGIALAILTWRWWRKRKVKQDLTVQR